jgi:hypothetical protein
LRAHSPVCQSEGSSGERKKERRDGRTDGGRNYLEIVAKFRKVSGSSQGPTFQSKILHGVEGTSNMPHESERGICGVAAFIMSCR